MRSAAIECLPRLTNSGAGAGDGLGTVGAHDILVTSADAEDARDLLRDLGEPAVSEPDFVSRGFTGRARGDGDRLPPGQYEERGFPVLTAGPTPDIAPSEWGFRIDGMVAEEAEWSRDEFHQLEFEEIPCDIHCVTSWSKLGTSWRRVDGLAA